MAASDKPYRSQYALDVVFALTSIVMLISILWMFVQDFNREYKQEQRRFRDVEEAMAQRQALDLLPSKEELGKAEAAVESARQGRKAKDEERAAALRELARLQPLKEKADATFQGHKADLESITSFYNISVEKLGRENNKQAEEYYQRLHELERLTTEAGQKRDNIMAEMRVQQVLLDQIDGPLTKATSALKKLNDRFDTQAKLAQTKHWGPGDWFRSLPILDAFASPVRIQQVTNNDVPIDYNFKQVTRFDRCATCHLGIERPAYTKDDLRALTTETEAQQSKLTSAQEDLRKRREVLAGLPEAAAVPDPSALTLTTVRESDLTQARVSEFCAHPRLDLYVGANSKHPAEKFGCSACHAGQGSATSFTLAAHTPNSSHEQQRWIKQHGWESQHMWDFPMLPHRFVESSCVKCHHDMTDLIASNNRVEAPKLMRGFNLLKENGCFGCHEIAGTKRAERIGPDVRLEPNPPLEDLSPLDRAKLESDIENPPGRMRKVGPSLYRVSEKLNKEFTAKWLRAPREFRPDTKMPHFYGLSNNDVSVLPADQKKFPDTEIWAVTEYLFGAADNYLAMIGDDAAAQADEARHTALSDKKKAGPLPRHEQVELNRLTAKLPQRSRALRDKKAADVAQGLGGNAEQGRILFTERGCLACHVHDGTLTPQGAQGKANFAAAVEGEAVFGPNLSQLAAKLGKSETSRKWLVQWITNPHVYSPRSRMPITHLEPQQAADIAAWLLSQPATDLGAGWDTLKVEQPTLGDMKKLAEVYLVRIMARDDMERLLKGEMLKNEKTRTMDELVVGDLPVDEQELALNFGEGALKLYLGKKAVGRLGCYGCHDIPGFDNAKPIGVGLNDWGKKAPERLAFEDIVNFVRKTYYIVDSLLDDKGKPHLDKDGKKPYERFFADKLTHHGADRIGYLNQKLLDPRSYDYERLRPWDDRARMPQFRFYRARRNKDEDDKAFAARAWVEESDARQAVMTFILGLVAEQVPVRSINQPKGDRLAEVKGRQILDKYNCGGCHLLRPGVYDFKVTPQSIAKLDEAHSSWQEKIKAGGYEFLNHNHWIGSNVPTGDRLEVHAPRAVLIDPGDDEEKPGSKRDRRLVAFFLAEAVRYLGPEGLTKDISANNYVFIPLSDIVPDAKAIATQADLNRFFSDRAPMGGTLSNLLLPYLQSKDPLIFKLDQPEPLGDSGSARAALPPPLLTQGERTQPDWLYNFLLDPHPVRRMTILRMPKFNMSNDEARALVDYFAAVERITNTAAGLQYPLDSVPQQGELDNPYWSKMNQEYVKRVEETPKDDKSSMAARLAFYKKAWEVLKEENAPAVKKALERARADLAEQKKDKDAKQKLHDKEKDAAKKEEHKKDLETLVGIIGGTEAQVKDLEKKLDQLGPEAQEKGWKKSEAYAADAWRLVFNRKLCLQCHEVGDIRAGNQQLQGPPLASAHQRLRPEWTYRWIASPSHFSVYAGSPMTQYFPANSPGKDYHHLFTGNGPQMVQAARDVLMNYPRVSALPVNKMYRPEMSEEKKSDDKK